MKTRSVVVAAVVAASSFSNSLCPSNKLQELLHVELAGWLGCDLMHLRLLLAVSANERANERTSGRANERINRREGVAHADMEPSNTHSGVCAPFQSLIQPNCTEQNSNPLADGLFCFATAPTDCFCQGAGGFAAKATRRRRRHSILHRGSILHLLLLLSLSSSLSSD